MGDCCTQLNVESCTSIVPADQCLRIYRNTDSTFEAILTDARNEPFDITLDTVVFTVRDFVGGALKIQKSNGPGSHIEPVNGRTSFDILKTDITDAQDGDRFYWVYEIRRIQPSGKETVHITGDFIVDPEVGD